jgi:RNA polymerase sigma-70 factor, ECF subfamily
VIDQLAKRFIKQRTDENFRALYTKLMPDLYTLSLRFNGFNKSLAEEAIQDLWLIVVSDMSKFRWKSSFKTWVIGILLNLSRQLYKKNSQTDRLDIRHEKESKEYNHSLIDLEMALAKLAEGYREIIILHDIEGYKHREIAEILHISEGTSKSQLYQGRNKLRTILAELGGKND